MRSELFFADAEIVFVDVLEHAVNAVIHLVAVAHLEPKPAVDVSYSRPYAFAAEEVIAVHFPHVGRIVLEPLEVHFAKAFEGVLGIFVVMMEIEAEVHVAELVAFLWTAARRVALEP